MKLASVFAAFLLAFAISVPAYAMSADNIVLEVGISDLSATVPLCTYWYAQGEHQGITPVMTVTNNGFAPIVVSSVKLPGRVAIPDIPCTLMQSEQTGFVLPESPDTTVTLKQTVKVAVIFTISKIGE
jgi:hypothetical protein